MKFTVWLKGKHYSEADDAEQVEAESAERAVHKFAFQRYQDLQHVDPGACYVRDGTKVREFEMWTRVVFHIQEVP